MTEVTYRWMDADEVTKVGDIDRRERIRVGYRLVEGELQRMDVQWDAPPWGQEGEGEHTVAYLVGFCEEHLQRNGRLYGAFDGEKLVGVGLIQQEIRPGMAQLAFLHVSNGYRRHGIGRAIANELIEEAIKGGASKMYVSATPSGSAVGFYQSFGFQLTDEPLRELHELEPEDMHMIVDL